MRWLKCLDGCAYRRGSAVCQRWIRGERALLRPLPLLSLRSALLSGRTDGLWLLPQLQRSCRWKWNVFTWNCKKVIWSLGQKIIYYLVLKDKYPCPAVLLAVCDREVYKRCLHPAAKHRGSESSWGKEWGRAQEDWCYCWWWDSCWCPSQWCSERTWHPDCSHHPPHPYCCPFLLLWTSHPEKFSNMCFECCWTITLRFTGWQAVFFIKNLNIYLILQVSQIYHLIYYILDLMYTVILLMWLFDIQPEKN